MGFGQIDHIRRTPGTIGSTGVGIGLRARFDIGPTARTHRPNGSDDRGVAVRAVGNQIRKQGRTRQNTPVGNG